MLLGGRKEGRKQEAIMNKSPKSERDKNVSKDGLARTAAVASLIKILPFHRDCLF
jgi:hypothetical protein